MEKKINKFFLSSALFLLLTACGDDHSSTGKNKNDDVPKNNIENPVVRIEGFTKNNDVLDPVSAEQSLLTYKMLGVDGKETLATTLVFTPKTQEPKNGWSIVVWAHGTTGVADKCAPSQQGLKGDEKLIAELLKSGYVVVAPDYEGLGSEGNHPFLNLKSEAFSITDAVVATRDYLSKQGKLISKEWLTVGHSQGGQAALGAAQYESRTQLDYKGTIAIAPASNLEAILVLGESSVKDKPLEEQVSVFTGLDTFTSFIVAGMQGHNNSVPYNEVFKSDLGAIAPEAENKCLLGLGIDIAGGMALYAMDHNYSLLGYGRLQDNFMQNPTIKTFLNKDSQPLQVKVKTPVIIYQGLSDTTIPSIATDLLVSNAKNKGTNIRYITVPDLDHSTIYSSKVSDFIVDVKSLMPIQ